MESILKQENFSSEFFAESMDSQRYVIILKKQYKWN